MYPEFEVHMLNENGIARANMIKSVFENALEELMALVGPGRHLSIVRTKLEEACFFSKKGMACHPKNQK